MSAILGIISPDPVALELGTGYSKFHSPAGTKGLAKEQGDRLDILAVESQTPGTGQFKSFIEGCKAQYSTVCVWLDWNPEIGQRLSKWGFSRVREQQLDEVLEGWRWDEGGKQ